MRLAFREKVVLGLGAACGATILAYTLIVTPYMEKMRVLDRRISQKSVELKEISTLAQEYMEIKEGMEQLKGKARKKGGFSLFSHLEGLAGRTRIKGNIASMKPQSTPMGGEYKETSVEVKLENITTRQLIEYLFGIEDSEAYVRIKRLHLKKRTDNPQYLDATFLVSTYEMSEER
jgi:hypothetical protein